MRREPRCVCIVVTRDRPALLAQCLDAVQRQTRRPDLVIVVDNASGPETQAVLATRAAVSVLRLPTNTGGAGGYCAGIRRALDCGADWLWIMDDDGRPCTPGCLASLLDTAGATAADLVGPLVVDVDDPDRLAFPIRTRGQTRFRVNEMEDQGPIEGFAHLFNGALIHAGLVRRIGLPDPRFFIRGDEVEFLYRARRAGARIVLDVATRFLHPGSHAEIHPILAGAFYAVWPQDPVKQYFQVRNRAYIFLRYRMWLFLAADVVRYGAFFLITRQGDVAGFCRWFAASCAGWSGRFMSGRTPAHSGQPAGAALIQPEGAD